MRTKHSTLNQLANEHLEMGKPQRQFAEHLKQWHCHTDKNAIQWWCLDQEDSNTNLLSQSVLGELKELIEHYADNGASDVKPKAIVIRSRKANGFIAGADIKEFKHQTDPAQIEQVLADARATLFALEQLSIPTIGLIHGFCLGGGLELVLACRYRFARADAKLGFPEVNLGLHPGIGGTVRLTQLIDPSQALKMMLTGKPVAAEKAKQLGLVDMVGEEHHFYKAIDFVLNKKLSPQRPSLKTKFSNTRPIATIIANQAEKQTEKKVDPQHYPAPFALIDLYRQFGAHPDKMYPEEGKSFAALLCGPTSQHLVRLFLNRETLKANNDSSLQRVHIVGAGTMGGDIAAWCALNGYTTSLEDPKAQAIAASIKRAIELFSRKCSTGTKRQRARDRLIPDPNGYGRKKADLIIEAAPEKVELKTKLLRELELAKRPDAILATNTSSILLQRLRENLQDPSCFLGIHFFNPVAKMPLVEVVKHDGLASSTIAEIRAWTTSIDKIPIVVNSAPGFLVNRVLTPYLLEALALLDDGVKKETLDAVAEDFGMPMGPIELADFIGLDICLEVAEMLSAELDQAFYKIPVWFKNMVSANKLGIKTGKGFYQYDENNKPNKDKAIELDSKDIKALQDRLILPLLNTCVHCLDEKVVNDQDELDTAVIFAVGFPPYTGGPLHYATTRGIQEIVELLKTYSDDYADPRFSPAAGWYDLATKNKSEHPNSSSQQTHAAEGIVDDAIY